MWRARRRWRRASGPRSSSRARSATGTSAASTNTAKTAGSSTSRWSSISGATLKDRLRAGPLPPDQAFDVSIQIAEGLAAIHKVGIIHRDLKSPNVMIDDAGTAKVMDFGIA